MDLLRQSRLMTESTLMLSSNDRKVSTLDDTALDACIQQRSTQKRQLQWTESAQWLIWIALSFNDRKHS